MKVAGLELPEVAPKRGRADPAAEDALLRAIGKAPDAPEAWTAYAHWLCERGDPLGRVALVARACRDLEEREEALLARHRDHLLGPLAAWIDRGWLDVIWRHGFLQYVRIDVDDPLGLPAKTLVDTLFDHPSAQLVTELRLSGYEIHNDNQQELFDAVVARRPRSVRDLAVSGVYGMSCGDVSTAWAAFPQLTAFTAFGSGVELGEIDAPELVSLEIHLRALTTEVIGSIARAHAPKLTSLRLASIDPDLHLDALRPIFAGATLPKLDELLLYGASHTEVLADAILATPVGKRLTRLALWNNDLSKAAIARLKKQLGAKLVLD